MITAEMVSRVKSMRPSVPSKDFALSQRFYGTLGFALRPLGPQLVEMGLGQHTFLLQDFYKAELAENFVMHMQVGNTDEWWKHIDGLALEKSFAVRAPRAPKLEPWGLRVLYLFDPAGILWQIASRPT